MPALCAAAAFFWMCRGGPPNLLPAAEPLPAPQWIGLYDMQGKIGLKWIQDPRFTSVRILRRAKSGEVDFDLVGETSQGQFIDEEVRSGEAYIYRLVAVGADGVPSSPSADRSTRITFTAQKALAPPRWEGYLFTDEGVGLKWLREGGAEVLAYNVYRKSIPDGELKLIGSTKDPNYHDRGLKEGEAYLYVLTALDTSFRESLPSEELRVLIPLPEAPSRVKKDEIEWSVRKTRLLRTVTMDDAPFVRPADVVLGPRSGRVFVSDTGDGRIHLFTAAGDYERSLGGGEGEDRLYRSPLGLAVDGDENLYAVDSSESSVIVMTGAGAFRRRIDLARYFAAGPMGLVDAAVAPDGRVFVVDNYNNRVSILGADGLVTSFGEPGFQGGQFSAPTFCDIDSGGFFYVADALNSRVQIFDSLGGFVRSFGRYKQGPGGLGRPKGVAVNDRGEILVADSWQNVIQVFDAEGRFLSVLADESGRLLDLGSPNGIALGGGKIYIVERLARRLQIREFIDGG